jgi:hypothetical protein
MQTPTERPVGAFGILVSYAIVRFLLSDLPFGQSRIGSLIRATALIPRVVQVINWRHSVSSAAGRIGLRVAINNDQISSAARLSVGSTLGPKPERHWIALFISSLTEVEMASVLQQPTD